MDHKMFVRAHSQYEIAQTKLGAMKQAKDVREVALLWSEFLVSVQRCFTRLLKATEHGPSKGWMDRVLHTRRRDQLLSYVTHARNADEHGIEPITQENPWKIDFVEDENLKMVNGQYVAQAGKPIQVTYSQPESKLVSVVDRGIVYNPPSEHLGKAIESVTPIAVAELALAFLRATLDEATDKFG